jgi:protease-4
MIRKFFNYIWRFFLGLMKALQVLIFFGFIILIVLIFRDKSDGGFSVPDSAALVIAPSGTLVEQVQGEPLDLALANLQGGRGPGQTVVSDIVASLEVAATDDRIKVVVLLPQLLQAGGLSKLQAVGAALDEFRSVSGKPVIAMADNYDQTQYYLASRADEIYMHDFGLIGVEGFGYFKTYFADAIDMLKVDVNVFRVGEFKSFVEPYLRNDMSDEDKVAAERWLNGLWSAFQADVTTARELEPDALMNYVDGLAELLRAHDGDAGQAALAAGFIDGLMSHQEFRDYIIEQVGASPDKPDEFSNIDFRTYLSATRLAGGDQTREKNVGILVASGNIVDGEAAPGSIGSASLTRLIRQAANDESIDALVLRVDSPGGSMFASEVVYDQLQELKALGKPLVVSMSSVAASGGYYISLPADEIWASATSISGSIGVGAIYPTFQRSLQSIGVNVDGFGTTGLSGQFSGVLELNDDARELLNISVKSAYDIFIAKVAEARGMEIAEVDEVARGRVWIGSDALDIGLVDRIGDLDDAVASAASLADLEEDAYGVKYVKRELTISEQILMQYAKLLGVLFSDAGGRADGMQILIQRFAALLSDPLELLDAWNDPRGVYLHCFCDVQ